MTQQHSHPRSQQVGGVLQDSIAPFTPLTGPRRIGAWCPEEIEYTHYLSEVFKAGMVEGVPNGKSLRKWLSEKLNCSPMRLSKKFDKDSGMLGLVKFQRNQAALDALTSSQRRASAKEVCDLRERLVRALEREAAGLKPLAHHLAKHHRGLYSYSLKEYRRKLVPEKDIPFKSKAACNYELMTLRKSSRACVARRPVYSNESSESEEEDTNIKVEPFPFHEQEKSDQNYSTQRGSVLTPDEVQWLESFADGFPPLEAMDSTFWKSIHDIDCTNDTADSSVVYTANVFDL